MSEKAFQQYQQMGIAELKKAIKKIGKRYETLRRELYRLKNSDLFQAQKALRQKEIDEFLEKLFKDEASLKGVFESRHRIVEIVRQLKSKDITIRMQEELRKEKSQLIKRLRNECTHKLAIQFTGYDLNYGIYETSLFPRRVCLICGKAESGVFEPPPYKYNVILEALLKINNKEIIDNFIFKDALWVALKRVVELVKDKN
ncbi:MAG: hypothetical protein U9P90_03940 [Patescibacteria group bacterium]|nr:hypothetical protein [Patescibacteria group bacterium]